MEIYSTLAKIIKKIRNLIFLVILVGWFDLSHLKLESGWIRVKYCVTGHSTSAATVWAESPSD